MANFPEIKGILNRAMAASLANTGQVNLQNKHREPTFPNFYGDFTNVELRAGLARGLRLIQPELVPPLGTVANRGDEANIVKALRGTLPGFRQMPGGGPPMPDADIATLVDWINHGCPD